MSDHHFCWFVTLTTQSFYHFITLSLKPTSFTKCCP